MYGIKDSGIGCQQVVLEEKADLDVAVLSAAEAGMVAEAEEALEAGSVVMLPLFFPILYLFDGLFPHFLVRCFSKLGSR